MILVVPEPRVQHVYQEHSIGNLHHFWLNYVPRPAERPRAAYARGAKFPVIYTPKPTKEAVKRLRMIFLAHVGQGPAWGGEVFVEIDYYLHVPASWSRKKKSAALGGALRPTGKPDLDNSIKTILDAMTGFLFKDDAQVVQLRTSKYYGEADETFLQVYYPKGGTV